MSSRSTSTYLVTIGINHCSIMVSILGFMEVPIVDMWKKPTVGFPKLDVDAGRGRDGSCLGYSAILRDAAGDFIAARSWAIYGGVRMFS